MLSRDTEPAPKGHYTPAVVVNGPRQFVFVSGQLPLDPVTGAIEQKDILGQARQSLTNALTVLASVGGTAADIVKVTIFATNLEHYDALNAGYAETMQAARPARSIVQVARLPQDAMVEIELIAALVNHDIAHGDAPSIGD
jgi:2-iminobutanoate/2-iminopropanoate deaminase